MAKNLESRFSGLLKKREKAISIFRKAYDGLLKNQEKIMDAIFDSRNKIGEHEDKIGEERDAIVFLEFERSKTQKTAEKIKSIIE